MSEWHRINSGLHAVDPDDRGFQYGDGVFETIAVRNGHFYALRCLEALGIRDTDDGIIRISMVHYNTTEEVDRLVQGIKELYR